MEHNKEKQIEEMAKILHECKSVPDEICDKHLKCAECKASRCYDAGYRKASEVAMEAVDDFQSRLRNIFLDMCEDNDYNTVNLLQIDSAIEALFESVIAELKKKYTERYKQNG